MNDFSDPLAVKKSLLELFLSEDIELLISGLL